MSCSKRSGSLYRNPRRGKVAGVCAGLSEFLGMETWLVRIIAISIFVFNFGLAALAYGAAWLLLDKKPKYADPARETKSEYGKDGIHVKSKVWQSGELPKQVIPDLTKQFDGMDAKLTQMEKVVTSREFKLNREFNQL